MKAAALVWLLLLSSLPVTAAEVVIEADRLAPPELTADFGETVTFVNRSARLVHIEFAPRPEGHHVFQVPGQIRATFHRSGRHPYVVHLELGGTRAALQGVVNVNESRTPDREPPVCHGRTLEGICVEP